MVSNNPEQTTGKVEFSIPTSYNDERPAITRTVSEYRCPMEDHPIASRLPRADIKPALVANVDDYQAFWLAPGDPKNFHDMISSDRSALSIHTHIFADGTVLVLHWSHALFDVMGLAAVMRAWMLTLEHRSDEIRPPLSHSEDPLVDCQKQARPETPYVLAESKLRTPAVLRWAIKNIGELAIRRQEVRILCIPGEHIEKMRARALEELNHESNGEAKTFLTESDILTAWLARLIHAERPQSKPVS